MPREWGRFSIASAIMFLAGTIAFAAVLKKPFNVGSIGQWASALGTTVAVWVALRNTRITLAETTEREAKRQTALDNAYVAAMCAVSNQINESIQLVHSKSSGTNFPPARAKGVLHRTNVKGLVSALDRLPLHQAPDVFWIGVYDNVRTAGQHFVERLEEAGSVSSGSVLHFKEEADLLEATFGEIKEFIRERAIDVGDIF